jgi:hypothetical protein
MLDSGKSVLSGTNSSNQNLIEEGKTEFLDNPKSNINIQKERDNIIETGTVKKKKTRGNYRPKTIYKKDYQEEDFQHEPEMWKQD